jgi:low molecular weight protein-tyrosine phosphatase
MAADRKTPIPGPRGDSGDYRVCLVCLGNICRSPMAEVILRRELAEAGVDGQVTVESAGTGDWHLGGPMDPRAAAELARRGYDGSAHIARQIGPDWLAGYDLFVVMDRLNLAALRRMAASRAGAGLAQDRIRLMRSFDPEAPDGAEVPDPYHGGPAEYEETFDLVLAAARGLTGQVAGMLAGQPGRARP